MIGNVNLGIELETEFNSVTEEILNGFINERNKKLLENIQRYLYIYESINELKLLIQFPMMNSEIKLDITKEQSEKLQKELGLRVLIIPF